LAEATAAVPATLAEATATARPIRPDITAAHIGLGVPIGVLIAAHIGDGAFANASLSSFLNKALIVDT
jgi:hypothetical protein